MVDIGSVIRAQVTRVEPYGVYLQHGNETVIVLAPEVSWLDKGDLRQRITMGMVCDVLVLRYNYPKKEIVGSIRRLHPEQNPYRQLARLEPGAVLRGKVETVFGDEVRVLLPGTACGYMAKNRLKEPVAVGDAVDVMIAALEVDEGRLTLDLVGCVVEPRSAPAIPANVQSPVGVQP